jgi:endonuclease/exonuclease/phosphatase family metal-dependent hydrolase
VARPATLRVGSWNLASGRRFDGGPASTPELAEAVRSLDVDVLALQELDRHQARSGGQDQLAVVASALDAAGSRFAATLVGSPGPGRAWQAVVDDGVPEGPTYGIGLVSRLPVLAWRVRRLGSSRAVLPMAFPGSGGRPRLLFVPDEPRVALAAVVDAPGGPVTVVSTHLSFAPTVSVRQLRALRRWVRTLPAPVVVAGDLNLPGPLPGWLTGWTALAGGPTYPAADPRVQLDHLLLARADGVRPRAGWVGRRAGRRMAQETAPLKGVPGRRGLVSDHLPLTASLDRLR